MMFCSMGLHKYFAECKATDADTEVVVASRNRRETRTTGNFKEKKKRRTKQKNRSVDGGMTTHQPTLTMTIGDIFDREYAHNSSGGRGTMCNKDQSNVVAFTQEPRKTRNVLGNMEKDTVNSISIMNEEDDTEHNVVGNSNIGWRQAAEGEGGNNIVKQEEEDWEDGVKVCVDHKGEVHMDGDTWIHRIKESSTICINCVCQVRIYIGDLDIYTYT